jgi:hypothetical protein
MVMLPSFVVVVVVVGGADIEHNDNADGGDTSEGWGHPPYLEKDKKVFTTKASCVCPKFKIYFLEK